MKHLLPCLAAVAILSGPVAGQDPAGKIDQVFGFATQATPGCALGLSQNGKVLVNRAYGLADVEKRIPLTAATAFDIGSVHKQFVAAAILLLVEDGRLGLTDDIRKHIPELPDYGHRVTIDHLLTHTSGLRDWTGLLPLAEPGSDVLQLILRQRGLNFVPGEEWSYSNSGYVLLKEIVARTSGESFAEFARKRIFEPLGMSSSQYVADVLQGEGKVALAYRKEGDAWKPFMRLGNERGGGGVISTASDLLRWNEALTKRTLGKFVTEKLEERTKLNNGRTLTYARGLNVTDIPGGPMISHSGGAAGYSTWLGRFAETNLSIAVLCNFEPVSTTNLAGRIADMYLPPVDPATDPAPKPAPGVDASGRAGLYFSEQGEPLRLAFGNGRLMVAGGPRLVPVTADRLLPQRADLFFRSNDQFEITFTSNDEFVLKSMEGNTTKYRRAQPWTPGAAEQQAVSGRYENREVGTVFEVVPGTRGVVVRFERNREMAQEMEPVAPDTYMRGAALVRFRRDAAGKVTGLDYTIPIVRDLHFARIGDVATETAPSATASAPPQLAGLVGEYEMVPGRSVTITLEGGQLYGEPTGNPKRRLAHVSGTTFAVEGAPNPITVTFTLDAQGKATEMLMQQNGAERTLRRVR